MKILSSLVLAIAVLACATTVPAAAENSAVLTVTNSSANPVHVSFHGPSVSGWVYAGQKVVFHFEHGVWGIVYAAVKNQNGNYQEAPDMCLASLPLTIHDGTTANLNVKYESQRILDTSAYHMVCSIVRY